MTNAVTGLSDVLPRVSAKYRAIHSAVTGPKVGSSRAAPLQGVFFRTLLCASLALVCSCEPELRVPRIEPVLHDWERPYVGDPAIKIHVFTTGTIDLSNFVIFAAAPPGRSRELAVVSFAIDHPKHGVVVFNTGLGTQSQTGPALSWGVGLAAEVRRSERGPLHEQMREAGLDPKTVSHVVLSDLDFNNTGDVESFPDAKIVVSARQRAGAASPDGTFSRMVASDFDGVRNWQELQFDGERFATLASRHDLFGDGSIVLVPLPGHARGSLGMLVRCRRPVLLLANAAYTQASWRQTSPPRFSFDTKAWWDTVWRVKKFAELEPSLVVVAGGDLRALDDSSLRFVVRRDLIDAVPKTEDAEASEIEAHRDDAHKGKGVKAPAKK